MGKLSDLIDSTRLLIQIVFFDCVNVIRPAARRFHIEIACYSMLEAVGNLTKNCYDWLAIRLKLTILYWHYGFQKKAH